MVGAVFFFLSRHAEDVILVVLAPPAADNLSNLEDIKICCGCANDKYIEHMILWSILLVYRTRTRSIHECGNTYAFFIILHRTHTRSMLFLACFEIEHIRVLYIYINIYIHICQVYRTQENTLEHI